MRIEWPSGTVQELENVASRQFLTLTEPGGEPRLAATWENGLVQRTLAGKQGSRYAIATALPHWNSVSLTVTVTYEHQPSQKLMEIQGEIRLVTEVTAEAFEHREPPTPLHIGMLSRLTWGSLDLTQQTFFEAWTHERIDPFSLYP